MRTCFFLLLLYSSVNWAQQNIWEGSKEQLTKTKEKAAKQGSRLQQWKAHIGQWGLDSNYTYALSLSGRLNTNGWAVGIYYLKQVAPGRKSLWQFHVSEIKHEKETKQQQPSGVFTGLGKKTPYIFGKINNVYNIQLGYGREQLLFPALLDGNLSVGIRYAAGPSVALLKPYYLKLVNVEYQPEERQWITEERYMISNEDRFLKPSLILGASAWGKGLKEIRYIPGIFAELALVFEPDRPKSFVKTITIGGNAAYYSSRIELMATREAYAYQLNFFVGLALGKRWR